MATEIVVLADPAPTASRPVASVRFLLRDSVAYGLANALVKLTTLVSVPILTRALRPDQFGAVDALNVILALGVALSTFGQDSAVARYFYEVEDPGERQQVVSQALLTQLVLCVLTGVIAVLLGKRVTSSTGGGQYASAYFLAIGSVPLVVLFQFWRGVLKWTLKRNRFIMLTVGASALNLLLIAVLAAGQRLDVRTYFVAFIGTNALSALLGLYFCRDYLATPRHLRFVRPMFRFGWPYAAVLLVSTAFPAVDRFILTKQLGLASLALYAIGLKYASLLLFPVMAFQTAWGPFCFATFKDPSAPRVYDRVLSLFVSGIAIACFTLVAVAEPAIRLFASPTYVSAAVLVVPLVFGLAAEASSWILGVGIDLSKRTELSLYSYLVGLSVSVALAWLLVAPLGVLGVAVGMSIGRLAQSVVYSVLGMRAYPLPLHWKRPVATLALAFGLSIAVSLVRVDSIAAAAAIRVTAAAMLLGLVYLSWGAGDRALITRVGRRVGALTF